MGYLFTVLFTLPCLIGGLLLSLRDFATRKVSRLFVSILFCLQFVWNIVYAIISHGDATKVAIQSLECALLTTLVFGILHYFSHGGFGLGGVTASVTFSLIFASLPDALPLLCMWWFFSSLGAFLWMHICKEPNIAFVPSLYAAALITFCSALAFIS